MGPDDPVWVEFARAMAPMMRIMAGSLAPIVAEPGRPMKVLDIAAGHGLYGIAVATHNPAAEIVAVDWKDVLRSLLKTPGRPAWRIAIAPFRDAFDVDLGQDYDLVLLPAFLHHFDPPTNIQLLKKIRSAMKPGAALGVLETMPNEDRVSPPMEAKFSMMRCAPLPPGTLTRFASWRACAWRLAFASACCGIWGMFRIGWF